MDILPFAVDRTYRSTLDDIAREYPQIETTGPLMEGVTLTIGCDLKLSPNWTVRVADVFNVPEVPTRTLPELDQLKVYIPY